LPWNSLKEVVFKSIGLKKGYQEQFELIFSDTRINFNRFEAFEVKRMAYCCLAALGQRGIDVVETALKSGKEYRCSPFVIKDAGIVIPKAGIFGDEFALVPWEQLDHIGFSGLGYLIFIQDGKHILTSAYMGDIENLGDLIAYAGVRRGLSPREYMHPPSWN
jgi:hypothetical protein